MALFVNCRMAEEVAKREKKRKGRECCVITGRLRASHGARRREMWGQELGREHILEIYQSERDRKKSYGIE